jgi:CHAD domain-containing protein
VTRLALELLRQMHRAASRLRRCDTSVRPRCDQRSVHALRVATRRARALLWSTKPWIVEKHYRACTKQLKFIACELAPLRNLDVASHLLRRIAKQAGIRGVDARRVRDDIDRRRLEAREALMTTIRSPQFRQSVAAASDTLRNRSLLRNTTPDALDPWRKRVLRGAEKLEKQMQRANSKKRLHRLRIRVKRCRYALEALDSAAPRRMVRRLRRVQAILGRYCDARLVTRWIDEDDAPGDRALRKRLRSFARANLDKQADHVRRKLRRGR